MIELKSLSKSYIEMRCTYTVYWSAEHEQIFPKFVCFGPRHGEGKIGSWSTSIPRLAVCKGPQDGCKALWGYLL